jgi:hypothetical protein
MKKSVADMILLVAISLVKQNATENRHDGQSIPSSVLPIHLPLMLAKAMVASFAGKVR